MNNKDSDCLYLFIYWTFEEKNWISWEKRIVAFRVKLSYLLNGYIGYFAICLKMCNLTSGGASVNRFNIEINASFNFNRWLKYWPVLTSRYHFDDKLERAMSVLCLSAYCNRLLMLLHCKKSNMYKCHNS